MESWVDDIPFERKGPVKRVLKAAMIDPLANYLPASWLRGLLRFGKSELAAANWKDPGGWRSMVISYEGRPTQIADKLLVGAGTMAMALRNRKRLGARLLARLIDEAADARGEGAPPVHVLCLGAGPGHIISDALTEARHPAVATLVDISSEAFDYGRELAGRKGVAERMHFIEGDVRDVREMLDRPPDMVKMLGICEYLTDEQVADIASAVSAVMPAGSSIVFNSLSKAHNSDRFFRRVFGLHMNHRSPEQLQALLGPAGFGQFVGFPEPLGVYRVMVGRRVEG